MPRSAKRRSSNDQYACPYMEFGRIANEVVKTQLVVLTQQWQLVQHCFSENSDDAIELNTTVQRLSSCLQKVEQAFSAGLNKDLRECSESVSRRFDAVDQIINSERRAREKQFQALEEIFGEELHGRMVSMFEECLFREKAACEDSNAQLREELQTRMTHGFAEGLFREKTAHEDFNSQQRELQARMTDAFEEGLSREKMAREDSSAQLRKIVDEERAIRKIMQMELVREKEAREQLRDNIEERMKSLSCPSSARSCNDAESAREPMESMVLASPPPGLLQRPSPSFDTAAGSMEEDCRLQVAGESLTASCGSPARLTGTWRFNAKNGWNRVSLPVMQLETQQQQQQLQQWRSTSMALSVKSPSCSGPGPLQVSTTRGSADCTSRGVSPRLAPRMLEVTQLQVQEQHAQVQPKHHHHQAQQHVHRELPVQQQQQQQQQSQQPQQSQKSLRSFHRCCVRGKAECNTRCCLSTRWGCLRGNRPEALEEVGH